MKCFAIRNSMLKRVFISALCRKRVRLRGAAENSSALLNLNHDLDILRRGGTASASHTSSRTAMYAPVATPLRDRHRLHLVRCGGRDNKLEGI
jgi:hypothetical protein